MTVTIPPLAIAALALSMGLTLLYMLLARDARLEARVKALAYIFIDDTLEQLRAGEASNPILIKRMALLSTFVGDNDGADIALQLMDIAKQGLKAAV